LTDFGGFFVRLGVFSGKPKSPRGKRETGFRPRRRPFSGNPGPAATRGTSFARVFRNAPKSDAQFLTRKPPKSARVGRFRGFSGSRPGFSARPVRVGFRGRAIPLLTTGNSNYDGRTGPFRENPCAARFRRKAALFFMIYIIS
jgi:hypothetical protein